MSFDVVCLDVFCHGGTLEKRRMKGWGGREEGGRKCVFCGKNSFVRSWSTILWMLWIGRARHLGPTGKPLAVGIWQNMSVVG